MLDTFELQVFVSPTARYGMRYMVDRIRGPVVDVIDGDTFEMTVTHVGDDNEHQYERRETIRIAGVDAPELSDPAGQQARDRLDAELFGAEVMCRVDSRDSYGRVVADVDVF